MIRHLLMVQLGKGVTGKNGYGQVWKFAFAYAYHGINLTEGKWNIITNIRIY